MGSFRFAPEKHTLRLEIEGHEFLVDPMSPALIRGIAEYDAVVKTLDFAGSFSFELADNMEKASKALVGVIDSVLGNGAYEKIRAGRDLGVMDLLDLGLYIMRSYELPRLQNIEAFFGDIRDEGGSG